MRERITREGGAEGCEQHGGGRDIGAQKSPRIASGSDFTAMSSSQANGRRMMILKTLITA